MPAARIEESCLDLGYARTNHKSQGATVDRTFILGDDGDLDRQAAYGALSRGRIENRPYVLEPDDDLAEVAPGASLVRDHVEQELSRDRSQRLAADHLDVGFTLADDLLGHLPSAGAEQLAIEDDLGIDLW